MNPHLRPPPIPAIKLSYPTLPYSIYLSIYLSIPESQTDAGKGFGLDKIEETGTEEYETGGNRGKDK